MPEAFKNHFNVDVVGLLAKHILREYENFDAKGFMEFACHELDELELKARSKQIAAALMAFMPANFAQLEHITLSILSDELVDETLNFKAGQNNLSGWILMPYADYITHKTLGQQSQGAANDLPENFHRGLALLAACTKRFSAEFAIRPFLRDFPEASLEVLKQWAKDPNLHLRRLVSEGSRPYLPWGLRLHDFAKTPQKILPLLEQLKDDESEYVRRSVANSLNDIAKDHPDLVAQIACDWWLVPNSQNAQKVLQRSRLIKHACRTLIKNGHPKVLTLLGFKPPEIADVNIVLAHEKVAHGDVQEFELSFKSTSFKPQKLLIDYAVHHQKANGSLSPKVFKWTTMTLPGLHESSPKGFSQISQISKKHSFKAVTTRKYYSGEHRIEILINGKTFVTKSFILA